MPEKKDYRERYKRIAESEWFKKAYHNKSIGEIIPIEDEIKAFGNMKKLAESQEDVPEDIQEIINEHFWEML